MPREFGIVEYLIVKRAATRPKYHKAVFHLDGVEDRRTRGVNHVLLGVGVRTRRLGEMRSSGIISEFARKVMGDAEFRALGTLPEVMARSLLYRVHGARSDTAASGN